LAKACEVCGKTQQRGNNVSHANNKSPKVFKPNLQSVHVNDGGTSRKATVCTRCIRSGKVTKTV